MARKWRSPLKNTLVPIGKAKVIREGKHITLVSYSRMLKFCREAADEMAKKGITVEIIDLRTIKPLDIATVAASVRKPTAAFSSKKGIFLQASQPNLAFRSWSIASTISTPPSSASVKEKRPLPYSKQLEKETLPNKERILAALNEVLL